MNSVCLMYYLIALMLLRTMYVKNSSYYFYVVDDYHLGKISSLFEEKKNQIRHICNIIFIVSSIFISKCMKKEILFYNKCFSIFIKKKKIKRVQKII